MPQHLDHVIGARPDLTTAASVIRALHERGVLQRIVHVGERDDQVSVESFRDLEIPTPDVDMDVGPGTHGEQTAVAMVGLEREWTEDPPTLVVVYGDADGTLAASLVAAKLAIPSAHVEADLHTSDRSMPDEVNRIVSDLLAELLFTTSPEAEGRLRARGVPAARIRSVGSDEEAVKRIADDLAEWLALRATGPAA